MGVQKNNGPGSLSRTEKSMQFFDGEYYTSQEYGIKIRSEIVQAYCTDKPFTNILDIGCGNGMLSVPLLPNSENLILNDVSENMLKRAKANIPTNQKHKVDFISGDYMKAGNTGPHDLIICFGVLAHVEDPQQILSKAASVLSPEGEIILQNTSSGHFIYGMIDWVKRRLRKNSYGYSYNRIDHKELKQWLHGLNLEIVDIFRYNHAFLFIKGPFSKKVKYKFTKSVFGKYGNNRMKWLGSDYVYFIRKKKERAIK